MFSLKQDICRAVSEAEWKLPKHVLLVPKRSAHDDTTQYCIGNSVETAYPTREPKCCLGEASQQTHFGEPNSIRRLAGMGEYTLRSVGTDVVLCTYYGNLAR